MKSSLVENFISIYEDFFDQLDPNKVTPMKEMCETQEETMLKQKPHFVKFKEDILVSK